MNMIEIKKTLWVVFICLMGHIVALAQKYQVRPLDLEQGLSCNYVVSIAQDKYGFLWFATEEGLNRFDGNSFFTYYKQRDRKGISSSELNCVIDDAKKPVVWIGTKNDGLNSFNYQTEDGIAISMTARILPASQRMILRISHPLPMVNSGLPPIGKV